MYETKVMLVALSDITVKAKSTREIYATIQKMANVEGLVLKSFDDAKKELDASENES
ncbi:MAG: hypothetical protein FWG45_03215 [Oscillospiraceae bacterium]|nr:hypothetical protein [Oscillospiraceae bacterium]